MKLTPAYGFLHLLLLFGSLSVEAQNFTEPVFQNLLPKTNLPKINSTNASTKKGLNPKTCNTNSLNTFRAGKGTTTLRPIVERVFSRKKRFLLAPAKTRLKFTMQLGKKLLATYPSGFNFNIEMALYYPMITSRLDLIPKRLRPTTTPKPKPKGPTPPLIIQIPGSLIRYKGKPAAKPAKVQRIDESNRPLLWVDTKPVEPLIVPVAPAAPPTSPVSKYYTQPYKWQQWSKYGAPGYAQRYEWSPAKQWPDKQPHWLSQDTKWSKWTTTPLPWTSSKKWQKNTNKWQQWEHTQAAGDGFIQGSRWKRDTENAEEPKPLGSDDFNEADLSSIDVLEELDEIEPLYMHFPELEDHYEWKHYHNYRDRRQLYHQLHGLSNILGIDLKSCIMRAICDCKRFLLPPGYSLAQDILRVMFTFPTKTGLEDDYSRIVQADYETCDHQLKNACPFNVLSWLMGQKQS
ncbi:uncharacterized protein LOC126751678 [Bactrocera neohumeralis]|uniref:uncharacterized protein LOC126751678 n=1 Tax=Bactrocera neohumeralis TaxID=98809 RepID=UPI0021667DE7|nr:uncharacterized protein LOC126751678 [Bactrocera neohumeralis]